MNCVELNNTNSKLPNGIYSISTGPRKQWLREIQKKCRIACCRWEWYLLHAISCKRRIAHIVKKNHHSACIKTRVMIWRRRRDSNPRDAFDAYAISSRAPSTKLGDFSMLIYKIYSIFELLFGCSTKDIIAHPIPECNTFLCEFLI